MKRLILIGITLLLIGCSPKETIKIGVHNWPPCEVWYVAENLGYFENLDVELVRFSTWTDNMSSLYKGNIDITHATYFDVIYYADKGEDSIILAPIDYSTVVDGLVVKSYISSVADLKGKTIGVEIGTKEHYLLSNILEVNGLSIEDVVIRSLSSYSSGGVFIDGEIDALFTYEPYLTQAAKEGNGIIIYPTNALLDNKTDLIVASRNSDKNESYQKVMLAWYKALDYIKENPEEAYEIMAKNEDMSLMAFAEFYSMFYFYSIEEAVEILNNKDTIKQLTEIQSYTLENDFTFEVLNVKTLLESPVLEMKTNEKK